MFTQETDILTTDSDTEFLKKVLPNLQRAATFGITSRQPFVENRLLLWLTEEEALIIDDAIAKYFIMSPYKRFATIICIEFFCRANEKECARTMTAIDAREKLYSWKIVKASISMEAVHRDFSRPLMAITFEEP